MLDLEKSHNDKMLQRHN